MTQQYPRPLPYTDPDTQPFWDACKRGEYLVQRNRATGEYRWPPGPVVDAHGAPSWEWVKSSGKGKVYSFCVIHHPSHPHWRDKVPYNVVLVELDEGVRVVGNLVGMNNDDIRVGTPVQVAFEQIEDVALPMFRPR
ncbi:MAG: OB-fold domain-containing protein [Chloroflexi bacterium]|nr:OB-fold domain-containing protein [Chloroflexota bacterium]